jgi:cold shock CspA family protein
MEFNDQTLPCDACGGEFVFRATEQAFFAEKGFSAPKRCLGARKAKKASGRGDSYDSCPFGFQLEGGHHNPRRPARPAPARAPRPMLPGTGIYRSGSVVKVIAERGFGFLRGEDQQDYFFDESAIEGGDLRRMQPGARVTFEVVEAPRGLRAQRIAIQ